MTSNAIRPQTFLMGAPDGIQPVRGLLPEHRVMREAGAGALAPQKLNQPVARETALIAMRSAQYRVLLQKIKDYQCQSSSAPSDADIEKWRECMEYRIAARKLQSDIVGFQVFPNCSELPLS